MTFGSLVADVYGLWRNYGLLPKGENETLRISEILDWTQLVPCQLLLAVVGFWANGEAEIVKRLNEGRKWRAAVLRQSRAGIMQSHRDSLGL